MLNSSIVVYNQFSNRAKAIPTQTCPAKIATTDIDMRITQKQQLYIRPYNNIINHSTNTSKTLSQAVLDVDRCINEHACTMCHAEQH